jgi:hypothetical protein
LGTKRDSLEAIMPSESDSPQTVEMPQAVKKTRVYELDDMTTIDFGKVAAVEIKPETVETVESVESEDAATEPVETVDTEPVDTETVEDEIVETITVVEDEDEDEDTDGLLERTK